MAEPLPSPYLSDRSGPRRSSADSSRVMSCADLTESLMAAFGANLGLNLISEVVLAVIADAGRSRSAPVDDALAVECLRRLGLLTGPMPTDPARIYAFPTSFESDED